MEEKKKLNLKILIPITIALIAVLYALSGGSSNSKSSTPWKDLGVSQKEYMDTYKAIKSHSLKY